MSVKGLSASYLRVFLCTFTFSFKVAEGHESLFTSALQPFNLVTGRTSQAVIRVAVELVCESKFDQMIEVVVTFTRDAARFVLGVEVTDLASVLT